MVAGLLIVLLFSIFLLVVGVLVCILVIAIWFNCGSFCFRCLVLLIYLQRTFGRLWCGWLVRFGLGGLDSMVLLVWFMLLQVCVFVVGFVVYVLFAGLSGFGGCEFWML